MKSLIGKIIIVLGIVLLFSVVSQEAYAQCAMCRATVENNISTGENSIGAGLNKGILFLLATPYAIFCVIAYFWYKHSRKEYEKRLKTAGYSRGKMSAL